MRIYRFTSLTAGIFLLLSYASARAEDVPKDFFDAKPPLFDPKVQPSDTKLLFTVASEGQTYYLVLESPTMGGDALALIVKGSSSVAPTLLQVGVITDILKAKLPRDVASEIARRYVRLDLREQEERGMSAKQAYRENLKEIWSSFPEVLTQAYKERGVEP